jgi:uncharacterized protein
VKAPNRIVITLTAAQRALLRKASGKSVSQLGIEPVETGSGWLYTPRGSKKSWLLKHPDPESYLTARKKQPLRIDSRRARFHLRIGKSRIHRWGVFAGEPIPARRNVIEYSGEIISLVESYRRTKGAKEIYGAKLDDFWVIDGAVGGSGAELVNHSCDPNLRWRNLGDRILYQSIRSIAAGEELTCDYHFAEKAPKTPCRCGSPKCRGTINVVKRKRRRAA